MVAVSEREDVAVDGPTARFDARAVLRGDGDDTTVRQAATPVATAVDTETRHTLETVNQVTESADRRRTGE